MANINMPSYAGFKILENESCLRPYQLTGFVKELMGEEWVKKFNAWSEHALPKQPTGYLFNDKYIAHPEIIQQMREGL